MPRKTIDFGIDLGTTNSTIAVIDGTDAKVIPNKFGSNITPSAVWIDKRGSLHVGQEAKLRALIDDPENADLEFKLRMGLGVEGKKVFVRSGREMLPEELSAEVLKSLRMDVQTNMGEELHAAVITVPAAFENSQTNATAKAGQLAGFLENPLLLEPYAASVAYGFQSQSENVYWMVYDFGGGTFDAAILRVRDGLIHLVDHDGDNFLGGKLIDWDIVTKKLVPALTSQFNLPEFRRGNPRWASAMGKMKYYAEQAKIEVCRTKAPYEIWIENLCKDADGKEVDFAYTLTPEDVEQVSRPYIEKSLGLCGKTLQRAGLSGSDMDCVLMVGGTTLNPWVREAVQAELGAQVEFGIDPVTVVARGAAIFASTKKRRWIPEQGHPTETWRIEIEHKPVGNVPDPDIGGRVVPPPGRSVEGFTIEFVDTKTRWRSGKISLGANGVFMTQLYAEKQRRHEYDIELCDPTGRRVPVDPDRVSYTIGIIPAENPPAAMTIGVGLADGSVATYVQKGRRLPARESMDHYTTIPLRAGQAEDELRIPLLEGEHPRAERNHCIGTMIIKGSDIRRDLPTGSQIEITLIMDESQRVRLLAYIPSLNEDLEITFDPQMVHKSLDHLRQEARQQKERLDRARDGAEKAEAIDAKAILKRIEEEQLVDHIDSLVEAAETDPDAVVQLDRRLRGLAATLDDAEDAIEWPRILKEGEESLENAERLVHEHGESSEHDLLISLKEKFHRARDARDPDIMRQIIAELNRLSLTVLERQPAFHVEQFEWLAAQRDKMRDPELADKLIARGRRAIRGDDLDALKAVNRQILSLLRDDDRHRWHWNIGGTITM